MHNRSIKSVKNNEDLPADAIKEKKEEMMANLNNGESTSNIETNQAKPGITKKNILYS
ncbi:hypothetical protein Hanom_Chr05g00416141 [Helianthus anomalus]